MRRCPPTATGLSLVELALAIAIIAVALSSIVALLGTASQSAREADLDATASLIAGQVIAEMRSVPFDALWFADPGRAELNDVPPAVPAESVYYFSSQGTPLASTAAQRDAAYACRVKKTIDDDWKDFDGNRAYLMQLHLLIHRPASAEPSIHNSRSFRAQIALY